MLTLFKVDFGDLTSNLVDFLLSREHIFHSVDELTLELRVSEYGIPQADF